MPQVENAVVVAEGNHLTPRQIVAELDRYVVAQQDAKRAVAIALRNRWRRLRVPERLREEILPKNIIMIGPTGVGKTEISRRLAKLSGAPFIKVEASKFTEVGYVGRDVESIIRDLVEVSHHLVKDEARERVRRQAEQQSEELLLDVLLPDSAQHRGEEAAPVVEEVQPSASREKLRRMLRDGKLEERIVEIETQKQVNTHLEILGPPGFGEIEGQLKDMLSNMVPKGKERRKLPVREARAVLIAEAEESLIDHEEIARDAILRAEQAGIVFIDEVDKICAPAAGQRGPDVSREGVQRDLLPLVEGSTVSTKYGPIKTDHVLFVASGAFHLSKPSDLMPEFQGRFPIRVELKSLTAEHFARILTEPENALISQYVALLETEGVTLRITEDAVSEIARLTAEVNSRTEDIGARRLHTLLEKLLDQVSFEADMLSGQTITIDAGYVRDRLQDIVADQDLAKFIL
ncbi:MAG: ATP-dependent protease ATPase subunit HslU [Bdellovibrionales bacterium]|nr:ATP-dependent protease ATPase subunit HslU [Bdellovibrionales bacterium]